MPKQATVALVPNAFPARALAGGRDFPGASCPLSRVIVREVGPGWPNGRVTFGVRAVGTERSKKVGESSESGRKAAVPRGHTGGCIGSLIVLTSSGAPPQGALYCLDFRCCIYV